MLRTKLCLSIYVLLICLVVSVSAQQAAPAAANAVVPPVVKFSGVLNDVNNKPLTSPVGVTFSLYKDSQGGAALWVETQNVAPDKTGHYSVMLGSTTSQGLPSDLFNSGEARWLGMQVQGEVEKPRTLLMSVPYALKAADAETIGGLPASAFLKASDPAAAAAQASSPSAAITGSGTANHITKWLSTTKLGNSNIFDSASGNVGIATTSPGATLDVNGSAIVRDNATVKGNINATSISALVSNGNAGVTGNDESSGGSVGVLGTSSNGFGVFGNSANGDAVYGQSGGGVGVKGLGGPTSFGVYGTGLTGVAGLSNGNYIGVYGSSTGSSSYGVFGLDSSGTGVYGSGTTGVFGVSTGGAGVAGSSSGGGWGVNGYGGGSDTGVLAGSQSGYAGWFNGNVEVEGNLSKSSGTFKIDHPLDPANKYLYHSFVESPDMMNIYNGVATLDANGEANVRMPDWFGVLNRDFRYQLTCIGGFAPVYIAEELGNNQFKIGGGRAGMRVSWQITGIRQDAWANAHRVVAEEEKPENERGFYLHPELFGAPPERGVLWGRSPKAMKQWKEMQAKIAAGSSQPKMESPQPPQVLQLPPRAQVPVKR